MSRAKGPGFCHKPLWWGDGTDAGCCDAPAYGHALPGSRWPYLTWACPKHGGPFGPGVRGRGGDHVSDGLTQAWRWQTETPRPAGCCEHGYRWIGGRRAGLTYCPWCSPAAPTAGAATDQGDGET